MPSRLAECCAAGIARSFRALLPALLNPLLQSPQQTGVHVFSLKGFSRFHSGGVFVCFVCSGFFFLFCFVSYCYFWPNSEKSPKPTKKKKEDTSHEWQSAGWQAKSYSSPAAFGAQGRDPTASTMTIQLVRKVWRCW